MAMQISDAARPPGTALVPVRTPAELPPPRRVLAAFVAHIIASAHQAPQTRARRRVTPAEAIRRYRAALARPIPPVLSRSM
jgi:hypothetical protein